MDTAATYGRLAEEWGESADKPDRANKIFDRLHAEYLSLRTTSSGREAISALMSDADPAVRLCAATHSLGWAPKSARSVLEALEKDGPPLIGHSARWTLRSHDAGTLDLDWVPE